MKMMTIFYSKSNGLLSTVATGEQDFKLFGSNEGDYQMIYDKLVIEEDDYVINNIHLFIVQDGKLKLVPQERISKYQVATQ